MATEGRLSLEEARGLMELFAMKARIDEVTDLRLRLAALERSHECSA